MSMLRLDTQPQASLDTGASDPCHSLLSSTILVSISTWFFLMPAVLPQHHK